MKSKEFTNYEFNKDGTIFSKFTNKLLKGSPDKHGYCIVCLSHNKKVHVKSVHRLIAETFIPNPENKPQVNHKDLNKQNNYVGNLEWVTAKENTQHAIKNGVIRGFKKGEYKNTKEMCKQISMQRKGRKHTYETKIKINMKKKGHIEYKETKKKKREEKKYKNKKIMLEILNGLLQKKIHKMQLKMV